MNFNVLIDWKFVGALGASTVGIIFATKMNPDQAKEVLIKAIDAYKEISGC